MLCTSIVESSLQPGTISIAFDPYVQPGTQPRANTQYSTIANKRDSNLDSTSRLTTTDCFMLKNHWFLWSTVSSSVTHTHTHTHTHLHTHKTTMIITLHDLELPEEPGLYWMRKQFVRHKLKHKVNSPSAPHILGKPRRNKLTAGKASHSSPGHQDSVEQGVTEGGAEERPFVLSWIQGCWLPFLSVEMWAGCRQGGKPLCPAPCPLQGKEVMEAGRGASVARGPLARVSLLMPGTGNPGMNGLQQGNTLSKIWKIPATLGLGTGPSGGCSQQEAECSDKDPAWADGAALQAQPQEGFHVNTLYLWQKGGHWVSSASWLFFFLFTDLTTTHAGNLYTCAQKVKGPMVMTPHTCRVFWNLKNDLTHSQFEPDNK